jgi:hypothetical protein
VQQATKYSFNEKSLSQIFRKITFLISKCIQVLRQRVYLRDFLFSDLYSIPMDIDLMPMLRMRGALAPNPQNVYCVLLI